MNGALIEQAEVNDLVNHVREGDEYAFLERGGEQLEFCTCKWLTFWSFNRPKIVFNFINRLFLEKSFTELVINV